MNITKLIILSFSLALDAFAIALCKGITTKNFSYKKCLKVGLYFGIFQAIMPLIGFIFGKLVRNILFMIGHYVVFFLLIVIGVSMIYDAICGDNKNYFDDYSFITLILLSLATSMDAFSVGIAFVFLDVSLILAIIIIGLIACILSTIGVFLGYKFGKDDSRKAKIIGGIILVILAIELFLEHM